MKKLAILFIFIFSATLTHAQQEAQVSHNMYNHLDVNPGYAGLSGSFCATLIARQQWVGFKDPQGNKGFPQTYLLSVDRPVKFLRGGIGMTIIKILVWNYHIPVIGRCSKENLGWAHNLGFSIKKSISQNLFQMIPMIRFLKMVNGMKEILSSILP
jgi:hypothetical protein